MSTNYRFLTYKELGPQFPGTFTEISEDQIKALKPDDFVQLGIQSLTVGPDLKPQPFERIWVRVTGFQDDCIFGVLGASSIFKSLPQLGAHVSFLDENILAIQRSGQHFIGSAA